MPQKTDFPRDRFDEVPRDPARVGAHRAPRPRFRWLSTLLWWLLAVAILTGAGILGFLALSQTQDISLPLPSSSSQETQEPEAQLDTTKTVLVLNGTDDQAAADAVRQAVVDAGWSEDLVVPLDADRDDFAETIVYYGDDDEQSAAQALSDAIGAAGIQQDTAFDDMSESGLTVVVGLDRVSSE
ncbi:LytR C-terminal domain-containing protein [Microbacterium indicum]|uniref:LytR C-terminal domain-containing protein n=1 Tax=Microbacterium indicum TaxID=358100 RepID=UPI0004107A8A|nr:LytR C-terminal domain-containing protein [Microbacterium indicum]